VIFRAAVPDIGMRGGERGLIPRRGEGGGGGGGGGCRHLFQGFEESEGDLIRSLSGVHTLSFPRGRLIRTGCAKVETRGKKREERSEMLERSP